MHKMPVAETLRRLLEQEDTDGDRCITVRDRGPKRFEALCEEGEPLLVQGTYQLANLLQELALARRAGRDALQVDADKLRQNPVDRLATAIRSRCWNGLTRRMDARGLQKVLHDPKSDGVLRLYVPATDPGALAYYQKVTDCQVIVLPESITPDYVISLNHRPGVLALAMRDGQPLPYVVPGGRFNEMYGWDSYFIALGLLEDGRVELAEAILEHFLYQIEHYGAILNANRTYYLTRSQPPFLTSLARALGVGGRLLERVVRAARREYEQVWMGPSRLTECGLSRYYCSGYGMPPETLMRHYGQLMQPHADRYGLSLEAFRWEYEERRITPPELDEYFCEDRSVRESGHDTSYRLEGVSTQLCPVDLNSLLYRYEMDMAELEPAQADRWRERARQRRRLMDQLCWDSEAGQYFDYNWRTGRRTGFESCTNLFPLWAGLASPKQAGELIKRLLPQLECEGGLAGGSLDSRGPLGPLRTARQWDYPYGWAPHQMLVWQGLEDYGYNQDCSRLAFRWLRMMTQTAMDFNGLVPEKYDVVRCTHEVKAEYANMGAEFDYVALEGFGWTNASYQVGLTYLEEEQLEELRSLRCSDEGQAKS
ncbi:MAG: trehalase family glycosidase [Vulcanimicrobiota bacterium]